MPPPVTITDPDDPRVAVFRNVRDRDLRNAHGDLFMVESEPVIRRLLRTPERVSAVLLSVARYASIRDALDALPEGVPVFVASPELASEIVGFHLHRGALAAAHRRSAARRTLDGGLADLLDRPRVRLLIAEGISKVDNMGGLFRNAAAFGAAGILLDPTCCDPEYRKSVRTSIGHVLALPWAVSTSFHADLARLRREWGLVLIGAEATEDARPVWEMPVADRIGIVVGSEWSGLTPATLAACDAVCRIPMASGVESINVATASAVFLYELDRQR